MSGKSDGVDCTGAARGSAGPARVPRGRRALSTLMLGLGLCLLVSLVIFLILPGENLNGRCSGIGFGCTLAPRDAALFLGIFIGLPTLLGGMVLGTLSILALLRFTRLSGVAIGLISLVAGLGVSGAVVTLWAMSALGA